MIFPLTRDVTRKSVRDLVRPSIFNILDLQPAAAYSLRSFDAYADPNVVNVRRSSDGATSDFTASEVSDGTLTSWVNTDVVQHNSDFTSGLDGYTFDTYGTIVREDSYEGQSDVLKYEKPANGRFGFKRAATSLNREDAYEITFDYYADSVFNNQFWGIESSFANSLSIASTNPNVVSGAWTSVTLNVPAGRASGVSSLYLRIQATENDLYGTLSAGSVRLKNVVVTQTLSNGHVTTWYDQSENGNDSTQTTASAQPKIVDGGTLVTEGGLAALDFDGVDDYFQLTSNVFAEQLEVALVNHIEENATKNQRLINLSNGTDDDFMVVKTNGEQLCLRTGSTESGNTSKQFGSVAINNHNLLYVTSTLSTDSYTASVDGTSLSQATNQSLASGSFSISTIGTRSNLRSTSFSEGTFQEIVVFNTDQSTNRTGIENNINDHFDIYS